MLASGVPALRLGLHPLFEVAVKARHALEGALILGGVRQIQDALHFQPCGARRGSIEIPVNHPPVVPVRLVGPQGWLQVGPVHTHPQVLPAPDLRERVVHPGMLAIVPQPRALIHLHHAADSVWLAVPVTRVVAIHSQEKPDLIYESLQILPRHGALTTTYPFSSQNSRSAALSTVNLRSSWSECISSTPPDPS